MSKARKSDYLGVKQLTRHIDYKPLNVKVNVLMKWEKQQYRVKKMWLCNGDCTAAPFEYAMTQKIINLILKTRDKGE